MRTATSALLLTLAANAGAWADAANGERLAQRWCTPCHALVQKEPKATARAPSLKAIAKAPEFSRDKLAISLLVFHPQLPEITLSRGEASDLAEYIATLSQEK